MRRKEIIFLINFCSVDTYIDIFKTFIKEVSNNFKKVYFVNLENLISWRSEYSGINKLSKTKKYGHKKILQLSKKIKIFDPIDLNSFDLFLKNKNPLIIDSTLKTFEYYRLHFYLRKKNIPRIVVSHIGNVQASNWFFLKKNINYIKWILLKSFPDKLTVLLTSLGIFNKIDIRFISNRLIYNNTVASSKIFFRLPSYYKEFILVKSKQFDDYLRIQKGELKEDIILLLSMDEDHSERKFTGANLEKNLVDEHYKKLNNLLENLSRVFKKKVVISIHPKYNLQRAIKRFKKYSVFKLKTKKLIKKSFLVLFFNSSAIIDAIILKKKIITIRSDLFKGKKYDSDSYKENINFKAINIFKKININSKTLINDLNSRLKFYDKYLTKFAASNLKTSGNKEIVRIIKSRYF